MFTDNHIGSMIMGKRVVAMVLAFLAIANCCRAGDDEWSAAAENRNLVGLTQVLLARDAAEKLLLCGNPGATNAIQTIATEREAP